MRAIVCDTREWRNWQTRTFEGRVVHTVRVQVPFPAPKKQIGICLSAFFVRESVSPNSTSEKRMYVHGVSRAAERSEVGSTVPFPQSGICLSAFLFENRSRRTLPPQSDSFPSLMTALTNKITNVIMRYQAKENAHVQS